VGKFLDKKLEELGAKRVFELGLADDDGNLEEDFMRFCLFIFNPQIYFI
jgi:NADPH-ferrihemoprotein reductase